MKKNILVLILGLCLLVLPLKTEALKYNGVDYVTKNLEEALTEEGIEHDLSNYRESDDQATIYVFRGSGCPHCQDLLTHLYNIIGDMGKYFKVVTFEVYNDQNNGALMDEVSTFFGNDNKEGYIPYTIIGDKTFIGYAFGTDYDEEMNEAIKELYNSKEKYDVFKEMSKGEPKETSNNAVIVWQLIFSIVSSAVIVGVICYEASKINKRLDAIEEKTKLKK